MSNEVVTKQELNEVKYGDLLAKFTELGIEEAWTPGKKKLDMIDKAIEKLNIKRSLEEKGLEGKEIEKELEVIEQAKVEAGKAEALANAIAEEEKDKQMVVEIEEIKLTKEQIESNIKNIDANLRGGVAAHRNILLKKRDVLEDLLNKS